MLYEFYDLLISPLAGLGMTINLAIVAAFMSLLITAINKYTIDQQHMKQLKTERDSLNKKLKEARKNKDEKQMNEIMDSMMKLTSEQFSLMRKSMFASLIVALLTFPWVADRFKDVVLSFAGFAVPFGWIGAYLLLSIPFALIFRKLLKVEM